MKDKLSGCQNQSKETAHAFDRLNAQIFNIQALLLIKAIAMFVLPRKRQSL